MAGRIPQTFIDDLLNRIDIIDVIDPDVPLKKTGRDFQALCPFHGEKTPSFTVSQEKQFYHCFGCGAHGSALGFLMNHRGLNFVEAIEEAARMVGLEVPREDDGTDTSPKVDLSPIYTVLDAAQRIFAGHLKAHPSRQRAVEYLKSRGLTGIIAKRFGIGFAPDQWDGLLTALSEDGRSTADLLAAGLIIENENGRRYDRFRDRITFPIHDRRGRVVGFGGRIIDQGEPKYLNSPETPVFQKRRELYGLYQLRQSRKRADRIIVVEGYMDVVALAQFGVENAVATLGTATTPEHLEVLFKTAPEITFCFDGDKAGRRAAWRALETVLPLIKDGRQTGFLFMPDGHDPDTYVRAFGPGGFDDRQAIKPLSEFLIDELARQTDMRSIDGRARFIELAKPLVKKIPRGSFQGLLVMRLSETAQIDPATWWDAPYTRPAARGARARARVAKRPPSLVDRALQHLILYPELAADATVTSSIGDLPDEHAALLAELITHCGEHPETTTGAILERFRGSSHEQYVDQLIAAPLALPAEVVAAEFKDALATLAERATKPRILDVARAEMLERSGRAQPVKDSGDT